MATQVAKRFFGISFAVFIVTGAACNAGQPGRTAAFEDEVAKTGEAPPVPPAPVDLPKSAQATGNENNTQVAKAQVIVSGEELCRQVAKKLASIKFQECMDSKLAASNGYSVKGFPLVQREYPPLEGQQPLGRILLVGGIHGDEYSSVSIVYKWMNTLREHHSGMFHWKVIPLLNPDGLLRPVSQRTNENGVDLNRNFPTPNWDEESRHYWVVKTQRNPRRYPGMLPLSEPESRWLFEQIHEFKPDFIVAVHAPYGILDFDGPREAPKKLGGLHLNALGTFPGSLGNYAGVQNDIPVITIELQNAGAMPPKSEISRIWSDLVTWLRKNTKNGTAISMNPAQADPS